MKINEGIGKRITIWIGSSNTPNSVPGLFSNTSELLRLNESGATFATNLIRYLIDVDFHPKLTRRHPSHSGPLSPLHLILPIH